jgi:hypothetical protein
MNYDEIFDSSFPRAMQRDTVRIIWHGYQETFREVHARHARPEAHDLLGHERRAYIERELRGMAQLYPDTVAKPEWNKTKTAAHTMVTRGVIKLTESKVRTPWTIVHPCVFRSEYAEVFNQTYLKPMKTKNATKDHIFTASFCMAVRQQLHPSPVLSM